MFFHHFRAIESGDRPRRVLAVALSHNCRGLSRMALFAGASPLTPLTAHVGARRPNANRIEAFVHIYSRPTLPPSVPSKTERGERRAHHFPIIFPSLPAERTRNTK